MLLRYHSENMKIINLHFINPPVFPFAIIKGESLPLQREVRRDYFAAFSTADRSLEDPLLLTFFSTIIPIGLTALW